MNAVKLPRTTLAEVGISPLAISAFVREVNLQLGGLHSMMLLRHGQVAAEAWWAPYEPSQPHMLYSLSKSFTSTAIGMAVGGGLLTVEDRVVSFFPDKLPATVGENLAAMRVKDLLTMTAGHETEPDRLGEDWVESFLSAPVVHRPGTTFMYSSMATHMLSAILQGLTGQRLLDYLTPRLFEPLGIVGATWDQSPAGIDAGGFGLKVRTEDIAKFGQLYLQKGLWNGQRLISEAWIDEATRGQVSNGDPEEANDWAQGYGYQFWRCRNGAYRGDGAFGQFCVVMPEQDAVLAITSGVADMGAVLDAVWSHLLPGMSGPSPLAPQTVPGPAGEPSSPLAAEVNGKTFRIEPNDEGIETIRLTFDEGSCTIETDEDSTVVGIGEWVKSGLRAAQGAWTEEGRFVVTTLHLDSPHAWSETYAFDGDRLTLTDRRFNVWFGPSEKPDLTGISDPLRMERV